MSALEPGRLYMAKVEGAPERLLFVETGGWADDMDGIARNPDCITDARPLIVLDLAYPGDAVNALKMAARDGTNGDARTIYRTIADQIEAQLKPARIPEPGLWGVVWASLPDDPTVSSWVHIRAHRWYTEQHGVAAWPLLVDPTLIREGVTS
jgi:hypothetical protein